VEVSGQFHGLTSLPWETAPSIHWIEGQVGTRAILDAAAKRINPAPAGKRTPVIQPIA